MNDRAKLISKLGAIAGALTLAVGWLYSFQRGSLDFSVFYRAWEHALANHGYMLYNESPDRYLYAPGFAWVFSPLSLLPRWAALVVWNTLKTGLMLGALYSLWNRWGRRRGVHWSVLLVSCFLLARPILIDFQYGQINLILLGSTVLALLAAEEATWLASFYWLMFSFFAMTKLMCLPLLLIPWVRRQAGWKVRAASLLGAGIAIFLPMIWTGYSGLRSMIIQWQWALFARGFPLESHNQSFAAVLHHWFSGEPVRIIALYGNINMGWSWLSESVLTWIAVAWALGVLGLILFWMLKKPRPGTEDRVKATAILCGLVFLPSHLVWKPYFIFGLPVAVYLLVQQSIKPERWRWIGLGIYFVMLNLTSVDGLGHTTAAYAEAGGVLFFAHLLLMGLVLRKYNKFNIS